MRNINGEHILLQGADVSVYRFMSNKVGEAAIGQTSGAQAAEWDGEFSSCQPEK